MATVVLTVILAALFLVGADYLHHKVVSAFNRQSVANLAKGALSRAEIATDYAVIKLGQLHEDGHTDCNPEAVAAINYAVFSSGSIKDILTARNKVVCSVAMHSETLIDNYFEPVDSAEARNPNIVLNPVEIEKEPAMAVTWNFNDSTLATALVNTEALVFDILPSEYREDGTIALALTNDKIVGGFNRGRLDKAGDVAFETFQMQSERYPLSVRITVPSALLNSLNMERRAGTDVAAAALTILLAFLVARGLVPSPNAASRVRMALRRGEIVPHFQPAYDVTSGCITGFEVLARWPGQTGANASPAFFVPLIEANGWANDLLETMVMQTAQSMRDVIETFPEVKFGFNTSPAQLIEEDFAPWFGRLLDKAGLDPHRVVVEITEREEIADIEKARIAVNSLSTMGIMVAIDDAGTGHNGLASVRRLGASMLKIDKLFVDGVEQDQRAGALVQMFVAMAHEFGMKTVAEGVEDENQLAALRELGVDVVQGFYLCRPLDAEGAAHELARHHAVLAREKVQLQRAKEAAIAAGKVVAING